MKNAFAIGFSLFESERFEEAQDILRLHCERNKSDWRATLWLARVLAEQGDVDHAVCLLEGIADDRSSNPVPFAFLALISLDYGRYDDARDYGERAAIRGGGSFGTGVALLAGIWQGAKANKTMLRLMHDANADLGGRALFLAETRLDNFEALVLKDIMDEIGLGWPGYKIPPPWLLRSSRLERKIWRLLGSGKYVEAFDAVSGWETQGIKGGKAETMIAAAIMANNWESALEWAQLLEPFREFQSETRPGGHTAFQLSLFRGFCRLQIGEHEASIPDFQIASGKDRTSYLPFYLAGRAFNGLGNTAEARRGFIAACGRLSPSLASLRWQEMVRRENKSTGPWGWVWAVQRSNSGLSQPKGDLVISTGLKVWRWRGLTPFSTKCMWL